MQRVHICCLPFLPPLAQFFFYIVHLHSHMHAPSQTDTNTNPIPINDMSEFFGIQKYFLYLYKWQFRYYCANVWQWCGRCVYMYLVYTYCKWVLRINKLFFNYHTPHTRLVVFKSHILFVAGQRWWKIYLFFSFLGKKKFLVLLCAFFSCPEAEAQNIQNCILIYLCRHCSKIQIKLTSYYILTALEKRS